MAASSCDGSDARITLNCSHGGSFLPLGPGGALRYVGGETRVLAVPRAATFRDLAARLSSEVAGGAEVRAVRHRLADEGLEDVIVSVTCDDELAHMRDEYDRLRATRPAARFWVFVTTSDSAGPGGGFQGRRAASELPPVAPKMRRVQSVQAQLHRRPALPAPMRRIQSAMEFAPATHVQPSFRHRRQQECCRNGQRRDLCMSRKAAAPSVPAVMASDSAGPGGGFQGRRAASELPPVAPKMQRVQSVQAQLHRRPALPAPMRRIQSAMEFAPATHVQPSFRHRRQQECCRNGQRRDLCMSRKAAAPSVPAVMATGRVAFTDAAREKARSRCVQAAMENRRAIWEVAS